MSDLESPPFIDVGSPDEHICDKCGKTFSNKAGLGSHRVFCKGSNPDRVKETPTPKTPREPKPKTTPTPSKRKDASSILGLLWGQGSRLVPSVPAQRAMAWQSPSAGKVLDKALAGSFVDKQLLQRVAGAEDKYGPLKSLVGLPVLVALVDKNPALLDALYSAIRSMIADNLVLALEAAAEEKKKADEIKDKARELGIPIETTDENGDTMDLIDATLRDLLAHPEPVVAQ